MSDRKLHLVIGTIGCPVAEAELSALLAAHDLFTEKPPRSVEFAIESMALSGIGIKSSLDDVCLLEDFPLKHARSKLKGKNRNRYWEPG